MAHDDPSALPRDFEIVSGVESLKLLAHPGRLEILEHLRNEALTGAMLAERLGLPANRIHHHLRLLDKAGLIQLQRTGRKRWKQERFYIATARQFLVDPALACDDPETARSLRATTEALFSGWRRSEVLSIGLDEIAKRVVGDCLRAGPDDVILLTVNELTLDLVEAITIELEARGARYVLKPWSRRVVLETIDRHTAETLEQLPFLATEVDRSLTGCVHTTASQSRAPVPDDRQRSLLPLRLDALTSWHRSLMERNLKYVEISVPRRAELSGVETSAEAGLDTFWRSFRTQPEDMLARAQAILDTIRRNPRVRISRGPGVALELSLDPTRFRVSDGVISDEDLAERRSVDDFPTGCLSIAPVRGTARGVAHVDYVPLDGDYAREVQIEIEEGRIRRIEASHHTPTIEGLFGDAVGEPDVLSEVAFGLNPAGRRLTGKSSLDSCLDGILTLGFGNNELLGGDVHSTLTLNLPSRKLTVSAGDVPILDEGRWA